MCQVFLLKTNREIACDGNLPCLRVIREEPVKYLLLCGERLTLKQMGTGIVCGSASKELSEVVLFPPSRIFSK